MIKGKVIIITGGAGLLGLEFAKAILNNNGIVVVADIDADSAYEGIEKLKQLTESNNIEFVKLDITSEPSVNHIIDVVLKKYNRIDAWVNNAYPQISRTKKDLKRNMQIRFLR